MDTVLKVVEGVKSYLYSAIDIKLKFGLTLAYSNLNSFMCVTHTSPCIVPFGMVQFLHMPSIVEIRPVTTGEIKELTIPRSERIDLRLMAPLTEEPDYREVIPKMNRLLTEQGFAAVEIVEETVEGPKCLEAICELRL